MLGVYIREIKAESARQAGMAHRCLACSPMAQTSSRSREHQVPKTIYPMPQEALRKQAAP